MPEAAATLSFLTADYLLDTLPWGLLVLGSGGTVLRLNQQAAAWWGLPHEAVQGQQLADLAPTSLPAELYEALQQLATGAALPPANFFVPARQQWLAQRSTQQAGHTVVYWQDVTEQLRGHHYQALADNTPDVLSRWDHDLRLLFANEVFAEKSGRPLAELLGRTSQEMGYPADVASRWMAALRRVFDMGQAQEHYTSFPTSRGEMHYYSRLVPEWHGNTLQTVLAVGRDITMLRRALTASLEQQVAERTQALQASNDLLQRIYDTSLLGMLVLHAERDEAGAIQDFRIASANQEIARATGRPSLTGKLCIEEYPGLRTTSLFDLMVQVVATGEPSSMEYYYGQGGLGQWFSSMFVKLGDGLVAFNLDITAHKQAEQEVRRSLGLLEQSEQIAEMGSWDYELRTGILRWSAGMYRLFGLPAGSPVSPQTYLDFVIADDRSLAECLIEHLQGGTSGFEKTLRIWVAGQVKTLRIKALMLNNEQGQPMRMLGVDLDISEVQRLEQENLRMRLGQQQARIGAVLEAQEEERRRLAESLHNGLGQLLYATKLQLDQLANAPELAATPALAAARHEASRLLSEVIRQARTLSHELTPGIVAEFGLAAALHDICRNLSSPQLHWQCLVHLEAEVPLPLQVAVYRLAQEVSQNIVKHAHATHATLEAETLPGWLVLRAEDNGRGFEPTAATRGIGLKTLRHRVALLGGTVHLSSMPGQGTQLQLRIPLAPTPFL